MNEKESRLMRLKRWNQEQIGELHRIEREAGKEWMIAGAQFMTKTDLEIGPFWDAAKPIDDRNREIELFLGSRGVKKAFAELAARTDETNEVQDIHAFDWAGWKEAPMPATGKGSSAARDKLASLYAKPIQTAPYRDD